MLLKKARKPISKKKQVSIIYQSEEGPQEQIGKQKVRLCGGAAAGWKEQRDEAIPALAQDGRGFPEIASKGSVAFLEYFGVLQQ